MAETNLRTYIHQLEGLFSRRAFDEVITHCQHILERYPKHLDTYRILGKTLLEQGQRQDASDIFLRVLSVDPSDFVAHAGMSMVYEEDGSLAEAIWHMERAFEVSPNNVSIQDELRRLYGKRDGKEPAKVELTRSALARLYAKGTLYQQAIVELTQGITEEPDRVDLQALLAQTLWDSQQPMKAGQVAARLLERLPHSIHANRILAELWHLKGQEKEARHFLARVEELDPYLALEIRANGQRVPAEAVTIPALEWSGGVPPVPEASPDWLNQLGDAFEVSEPGAPAEAGPITEVFGAKAPDEAEEAPAPAGGAAPDWLANIAEAGPIPAETAPAEEPEGATPAWLDKIVGDIPVSDELPDLELPQAGIGVDEVPDWLANIADGAAEDMAAEEAPGAGAGPPAEDLVGEMATEVQEPIEPLELEAWDPSSVETWESAPKAEVDAASGEDEAIPEWLAATMAATGAPEAESVAPAVEETPEDEALPDWLQGEDAPSEEIPPAAQTEQGDEEALPDWLTGETEAPKEEIQVAPSTVGPGGEESPEEEMPDFMQEGDFDSDDAMAWLESLAAKQGADPEEFVATPSSGGEPPEPEMTPAATAGSSDMDDDLDWLREPKEAEPEAVSAEVQDEDEEEELPEWMSMAEEPEEEAEVEAEPVAEADDIPDWLKIEETTDVPVPPALEPVAETPVLAFEEADEDDIPDWLKADFEEEEAEPTTPFMEAEAPPMAEEAEAPAPPVAEEPKEPEPVAAVAPAAEDETPDWITAGDLEGEDALAWLEGLAVEQGADPDKPITEQLVDETPPSPPPSAAPEEVPAAEEGEVPDWLKAAGIGTTPSAPSAGEPAAPEPAPAPSSVDEEIAAELDWLGEAFKPEGEEDAALADFLKESAAETPAMEEPAAPEPEPAATPPAAAADELPAWLTSSQPAAATEETDTELADFLKDVQAEEPVASVFETPEPEPAAPPPPPPAPEPTPAAPPMPAPVSGPLAAQLNEARQMLATDRERALVLYEQVVKAGTGLPEVIAHLTDVIASSETPVSPRLHELLGDALMAEGQTEKAIEAYSAALDEH